MGNLQYVIDALNPAAAASDLVSYALDPTGYTSVQNAETAADYQTETATANAATQAAQDAQAAEQQLAQVAPQAVPGLSLLTWLKSPTFLIGCAVVGGLALFLAARAATAPRRLLF